MSAARRCLFPLSQTIARAVGSRRAVPISRLMSTQVHPYKIYVGASFAGKPTEFRVNRKKLQDFPADSNITKWRNAMVALPKAFPSNDPGEDFFYVQEMRCQSGTSFGVADGVGGWVDNGVDPSLFSQALMYHAHRYSKSSWAGEPEIDPLQNYEEKEEVEGWELTPQECMELAHGGVLRERTVEAGSSTACMMTVNSSSGLLRAANLGDSGFCIIRSSSIYYRQPPQTHFFNCPLQLAKLPPDQRRYSGACVDSPRDADTYETKLRDGDIVIAYTDGLSDNVFSSELLQICALVRKAAKTERAQVQDIADRLVFYARTCMMNDRRVSPFERAAAREGKFFRGGKVDDVTVVVATIQETI